MVYIILLFIIQAFSVAVPVAYWSPWQLIWAVPLFCACSFIWYLLFDMRIQ